MSVESSYLAFARTITRRARVRELSVWAIEAIGSFSLRSRNLNKSRNNADGARVRSKANEANEGSGGGNFLKEVSPGPLSRTLGKGKGEIRKGREA